MPEQPRNNPAVSSTCYDRQLRRSVPNLIAGVSDVGAVVSKEIQCSKAMIVLGDRIGRVNRSAMRRVLRTEGLRHICRYTTEPPRTILLRSASPPRVILQQLLDVLHIHFHDGIVLILHQILARMGFVVWRNAVVAGEWCRLCITIPRASWGVAGWIRHAPLR